MAMYQCIRCGMLTGDVKEVDALKKISQLQAELDNRNDRILGLRTERKHLRIKDEVRLELLDENEELKAKIKKMSTCFICQRVAKEK